MNVRFSRILAIAFGLLLPLLGIVRNWTLPNGDAPGFLIDLAAGGLLLYGVWRVAETEYSGQRFLSAGWGLTVGLFYTALVKQVAILSVERATNAPIPPEFTVAGAAFGLLLSIVGLLASLRSIRRH